MGRRAATHENRAATLTQSKRCSSLLLPLFLVTLRERNAGRAHGDHETGAHNAPHLVQTAAAQVVRYDNVGDGVEHELDVVGVRCTCHVAIDFL